jgi:hypothetical protein
MSMCSGIGSSLQPIAVRRVDFPQPFNPSKPYRLRSNKGIHDVSSSNLGGHRLENSDINMLPFTSHSSVPVQNPQ